MFSSDFVCKMVEMICVCVCARYIKLYIAIVDIFQFRLELVN